ncbi:MAG: DinB family protein [Candidatus Dormibacteria bacterium]
MDDPTPLSVSQIASLLRSSAGALGAEMRAAPAMVLAWHPAPGEWCAKEVLGHLIEADRRGFAGRVQVLLEGDGQDLVGWDQQEVARARHDCDGDTEGLLEEFLSQRARGLELLERVTPEELSRSARHPKVGDLSIGEVVTEWVHHDRNHLKQILSNVQAYVWPQMGAAQGFSGE